MHHRTKMAILATAIVVGTPVAAQVGNDTGIRTETQRRLAHGQDDETIWNVIGMLGLLGLFGLRRPSDNDGYTDDPI
ncbi:MAG: WGxxGxxG family protein [Sphingomicrobium sp.]